MAAVSNGASVAAVSMVATPTVELLVAAVAAVAAASNGALVAVVAAAVATEQSSTISSTLAHAQQANRDAQCDT